MSNTNQSKEEGSFSGGAVTKTEAMAALEQLFLASDEGGRATEAYEVVGAFISGAAAVLTDEQIETVAKEWDGCFVEDAIGGEHEVGPELRLQLRALSSQSEARTDEARDAARYRWLRAKTAERHDDFYADVDRWRVSKERRGTGQCFSADRLDAVIDAAMTASQSEAR